MIGPVFVDTNVFIYAHDRADRGKRETADRWLEIIWRDHCGRTSTQVLAEYYSVGLRKLLPDLPRATLRDDVQKLYAWRPATPDAYVMAGAWEIEDRYGFSWWDALIVAAAQAQDCRYLLTEDLQHMQQIGIVTVLNPFRVEPGDID